MDIEIAIEPPPRLNQNSELISYPLDSEIISIKHDDHNSTDDRASNTRINVDSRTTSASKICLMFTLFTMILMTIGIIVVCLTAPKPGKICRLAYERTVENSIGSDSRPCSIALGDLDQQNQLDIVVTNSGQDSIGILFRSNNGTVINQTTYSTGVGSRPNSVAISDFNNDNLLDIAVANYGTNNIGIFLGIGNGIFTKQTIFSTGSSHPLYITVGDLNNDGQKDIAVVHYGTNGIGIFLGYGNGTFANEINYSTGFDSIPYSLALGDLNNDQYLDIAVANYGTDEIAIFFGYGNGSFTDPIRYTTTVGSDPSSVAVADLNNDHQLDIVVANYGLHGLGIFFGYGNGSFAAQKPYFIDTQSRPQYITIGDVNHDNQTDIVTVDSTNSKIHILPGYGNGIFSNFTTFISDHQTLPYAAAIGDLKNDSKSYIAVVNYGTNDVLVLSGYSSLISVAPMEFSVGSDSRPTSVALGDFNNDQFLDIVITHSAFDSIGVLIGYENGSFETEISYSGESGSAPQCVCTGDFNNDNRTDIAVANYGSSTVGLLLGFGNGSFGTLNTYSTGFESFPIFVTTGDFNNDQVLDIVTANFAIDCVAVLLGYGNGSFAPTMTYSTGTGSDPAAIFVADFNKDNQSDLAVANSENGNVGILFGNGDGSFETVITYSTGFQSHPNSIVAGDLNNDNWLDIIVADSTSDNLAILLAYKNGTFGNPIMYTDPTLANPSALVVGDLNYDHQGDIIVTNFGADNVDFLSGYGNGSFVLSQSFKLITGSDPKDIVIGDFNNDNRWDILIVEFGTSNVNLLGRYIEAAFENQSTYPTGGGAHPHSITVADFNNDNLSDIAVANSGSDNVGVFLGYGNGSFAPPKTYFLGLYSDPQYIITGDFNKDHQVDIATANSNDDSISIIFGYGNGSFHDMILYSTKNDSQPYWIATSDFNNDQRLDLVVANQGSDSIGILLGFDYAAFQDQQVYSNQFSLRPSSIIVRDFNSDTYLDIAVTFAADGSVGILFGHGDGTFDEFITYSIGSNSYPYEIIAVDVNNDNISDIVVANAGSNTLGVLVNYGNKIFASVMIFSTGNNSEPFGAAPGDFNNDTYMDIVVANYRGSSIGVLLGYGNGSFGPVRIYSTDKGSRPQSVAVGDFNQDGRVDIVVANFRTNNIGLFLGNGDGSFQNQIKFSTGYFSMPTFIIVADFNNDSRLDVAVSNKNSDNVGVFYGYGNGTFATVALYPTGDGTGPQCVRSGDFNNDKIIDIIVANPGTNYAVILYGLGDRRFVLGQALSTGENSGPISMSVGDFNHDGKLDFTSANYLTDNVGVQISNGNGSFGGVLQYSTGFNSYPYSVAVGDFNKDNYFDVVAANYGTNNIGIFFGYGNGSFATMLPYFMGDNSRPVEVTVNDLNLDNCSDIIVVNSESNNVYILFGNGNGSFPSKTIYSTSFGSLPYGVTITDFNNDGIPDMVIVTAGTSEVLLVQGYGNGTFGNEISYAMGYNFDPYAVAVGRFTENNWIDIAIADYGGDDVEILLKTC